MNKKNGRRKRGGNRRERNRIEREKKRGGYVATSDAR